MAKVKCLTRLEKRYRIRLEFSEDVYVMLNYIKEATGSSSYSKLVRKLVYEWIEGRRREGFEIALVKK